MIKQLKTSKNSYIGNLEVTKNLNDDLLQIEVISDVKVKLFISIDLKYKLNCTYKNNELFYSSVTTYINGNIHSTSETKKIGDYYTITKNGHSSKYIDKITFSSALLYHQEPKGLTDLYSEFENFNKSIKSIGPHEYQISTPKKGGLSTFSYKNDVLMSLTNHHALLTFKLTKI